MRFVDTNVLLYAVSGHPEEEGLRRGCRFQPVQMTEAHPEALADTRQADTAYTAGTVIRGVEAVWATEPDP